MEQSNRQNKKHKEKCKSTRIESIKTPGNKNINMDDTHKALEMLT